MLNVTLRQLQVFAAAAQHSSFARAAEELHLTAPAISMQIKELESVVGLSLFDRSGRALTLSTAGEYFLLHARRMLSALKDAEDTMVRLKGVRIGKLTLGMASTAKYFVPRLLAEFRREHPGIEFRLEIGNRQALVEMLHRNQVDLAIMGRPPRELNTRAEPFAPNPLAMIASPEHPLARLPEVPPALLAKLLEVDGLPLVRLWHIVNMQAKLLSPAAEALRYFVLEKGQGILLRGETGLADISLAAPP
jgi:LysR family transcriptional regulator, low CO2-responsive transcriptional regulator